MKYLYLAVILFFSACSIKNYEVTQTKLIIIKSPQLKFTDIGYLRNSGRAVELELFSAGVSLETISINRLVCFNKGCLSKESFNERFLNASYPQEIMQDILLAKPIYDKRNLQKDRYGFIQHIKDDDVDIKYSVTPTTVFFKDTKNNIILKIKDIKK